ncbi:MAG: hypothetical protein ACR2JT_06295 [Nocardioidaceae bacterium]
MPVRKAYRLRLRFVETPVTTRRALLGEVASVEREDGAVWSPG